MPDLPIAGALPALKAALAGHSSAVLRAPPGAGKTTRVPLTLLGEPWLAGQRIVMLEPRRLATRAAARHMARLLDEDVGDTIGYRVRRETKVGPATRVEVVTEGILTRFLQSDPSLEGIGLVIFDEFHERSLHADLGLALTLQTQALLREDLRILVMSATLDGAAVASLLGDPGSGPGQAPRSSPGRVAPIVASEGRAFAVETRYVARRAGAHIEAAVTAAVRGALERDEGDVLVFLPGAAEIHRVERMLAEAALPTSVAVAPLYGNLPQAAQDLAIEPSPPGRRKIVLATSIAETSLTIEGVRVVIDSGLMRVPRFSPRTGMTRLETVRVSRASADQRRGRAGRLGPGVCYRLWPEHEDQHLVPHGTPEILEADLAPLALELAAAGITDPAELRWLDPPPPAAFSQARELLAQLGAIEPKTRISSVVIPAKAGIQVAARSAGTRRGLDARFRGHDNVRRDARAGRITPHGRRMAELGLHPRLAHMLLAAKALGHGALACDLAALLDERDILRGDMGPVPEADVRLRLDVLREAATSGGRTAPPSAHVFSVERETVRRVRVEAAHLRGLLGIRDGRGREREPPAHNFDASGLLLAFAYPDRIAQRRPGAAGGRFLLRNGGGAFLGEPQHLSDSTYLVAAELDGKRPESRIFLAAPIDLEEIEAHFGGQIVREDVVEWSREARAVIARRRERLGALVLREAPVREVDPEAVAAALLEGIAAEGLSVLPWSDAARSLQRRVAFLRTLDPSWPDLSEEHLAATLGEWLAPHLYGLRRLDEVQRLDLTSILAARLAWEQRAALDELAPTHLVVPSGSRIPIDYIDPAAPVLAVRLQEMFGLTETPRVARGAVPLTLHLLSPAHRPVQVTRDLAGFWRRTYFDVRKDLKGRYPKHHWPDDPLGAMPTNRAKRRGE